MIGLLAAFGDFLPLAMAVALSPFPIVAVVAVLAQPRGPAAGVGFLAGWAASLSSIALLLTFVVGEVNGFGLRASAGLQIVIGLLLVVAAVGKWRGRPRGEAEPRVPGWMRPLAMATPGRAAMYGVALGANPKNIALTAAAAATIAYRALWGPVALLAVALYVALASSSVVAAVLARALGGGGAAVRLEGLKLFMLRHNSVIMMVVFLFLGLKILGDGLAELGS